MSDVRATLTPMTDDERRILDYADTHPALTGKAQAEIRVLFGVSATGYTQRLLALVRRADVEAAYPMLVHRIRRVSARAAAKRAAGQL